MANKKISFSEGLIIAATPALIYLFVYAFERGYCSHFKLPNSIISIGISNLLVVGGHIFVIISTLILIFAALPSREIKIIYRAILFPASFGICAFILLKSDIHFGIKIPSCSTKSFSLNFPLFPVKYSIAVGEPENFKTAVNL